MCLGPSGRPPQMGAPIGIFRAFPGVPEAGVDLEALFIVIIGVCCRSWRGFREVTHPKHSAGTGHGRRMGQNDRHM